MPRIHSPIPPKSCRRPPKKMNTGLTNISLANPIIQDCQHISNIQNLQNCAPTAPTASPTHEGTCVRCGGQQEANQCHRGRIAERFAEVASGGLLRTKIELLEDISRNGNALCGLYLADGFLARVVGVKVDVVSHGCLTWGVFLVVSVVNFGFGYGFRSWTLERIDLKRWGLRAACKDTERRPRQ